MSNVLRQQYEYIRSTREVLLSFLEEIPVEVLRSNVPNFGIGSILRTHIHVADCYGWWLGTFAFGRKREDYAFATDGEVASADVQWVRHRFEGIDEVVQRFFNEFDSRWFEVISRDVDWRQEPWSTTPLWLLTHTETHEFHHKGQIVSMARTLGYVPPETDLRELDL